MAQRLVVDCDVHGARDEAEAGIAYDVVVRKHGEGFMFLTVDLCEQCAKPLADLWTELAEVGRSFDPDSAVGLRSAVQQPRKRAASAAKALTAPSTGRTAPRVEATTSCPACAYVGPTRGALRKHVKASHGTTLAGLTSGEPLPASTEPKPFDCPECGNSFTTPQGMGAHRFRAHNVKGSSDSSKAGKAARAAEPTDAARGDE